MSQMYFMPCNASRFRYEFLHKREHDSMQRRLSQVSELNVNIQVHSALEKCIYFCLNCSVMRTIKNYLYFAATSFFSVFNQNFVDMRLRLKMFMFSSYRMFSPTPCAACNQIISPNELVMRTAAQANQQAPNQPNQLHVFHLKCFTCSSCNAQLRPGDR